MSFRKIDGPIEPKREISVAGRGSGIVVTIPSAGDSGACASRGSGITFTGRHWEHVDGAYRYPSVPVMSRLAQA